MNIKDRSGIRREHLARGIRGLTLLLVLLFSPLTLLSQKSKPPEYRVKSILLQRICSFVEWPEEAQLSDRAKPFVMAVFGENPFGTYLDENYGGKRSRRIKGKKVELRYISEIEEIAGSHLLFIGEISRKRLARVLEYTSYKPILTVADTDGYARQGVHINFFVETKEMYDRLDQKRKKAPGTSLEINETAARKAGLVLRDDLLKNARIINPYIPYKEKAIQLELITRFVTWPPQLKMDDPKTPFNIVVIGNNPFDNYLQEVYRKKKNSDKGVNIRTISRVDQIGDAHLLFVSKSKRNELAKILDFTKTKPILTVGDTPGFGRQGVCVNIYYDGPRLKYEVNKKAVRQAGLSISYHLLKNSKILTPFP